MFLILSFELNTKINDKKHYEIALFDLDTDVIIYMTAQTRGE